MTKCTLTLEGDAIKVQTPYDAGWVAEFKSKVPVDGRRPKKDGKKFYWLIAPQHGPTVQDLCNKYFGELPLLPQVSTYKPVPVQKILDVRYIGMTKDRDGADERSAYGWHQDGWNVVFPESVLRAWFDGGISIDSPSEAQTLYSVLCIKRDATSDEIKSGYRRMVRQWHPDRCKEPNAQEQFMAVQHAYEILSNSAKRERYDAGLALEASLHASKSNTDFSKFSTGYRSPLRCGLIMVEGIESMGIFQVSKIYAWQDIVDSSGRTLVVSWKAGDDHFTEVWA